MGSWAVVPAAGRGERLGTAGAKALVPLSGVPMLARCLVSIAKAAGIVGAVLAAPPGEEERVREVAERVWPLPLEVVAGGESRQASVAAALALVAEEAEAIVVHDAARPLAGPELFERAMAALEEADGAICAVPLVDTPKRAQEGRVVETVERAGLWRVQTPQAFRATVIRHAHEQAARDGFAGTDDSSLVERLHLTVALVPGDEANIKITTPRDLALAEAILAAEERR